MSRGDALCQPRTHDTNKILRPTRGEPEAMKILVFSSLPTHPTSAGNRARILAVCRALREAGNQVVFACLPQEVGDFEATRREFADGIEFYRDFVFRPRPGIWNRLRRRLLRELKIHAGHRMGLDDWHEPDVVPWLEDLHRRHRFDAVLVNYVFQSAVLQAFPSDVRKVIDTHDVFGDRHLQYIQAGMAPEWYSTSIPEEIRGLSRADVVLAIQEREAEHFRRKLPPSTKVLTVCPFMDDTPPAERVESPKAVVVASGNSINRDGIRWFLDAAFPTVRAAVPDFELVLVGDIGSHFGDAPGVVRLGRLPDLRSAYESGAVALNPALFGTGFCIKSLEAISFGMPFLSTRTGSRGLESLSGRQAFIEVPDSDGAAMARELVSLLLDKKRRLELGERAWREARAWNLRQKATLAEVFS